MTRQEALMIIEKERACMNGIFCKYHAECKTCEAFVTRENLTEAYNVAAEALRKGEE